MDLFTVLFSVLAFLYLIAFVRCLASCRGHNRRRRDSARACHETYSYDDDDYAVQTPDYSHRYDKNKTPKKSSIKKARSPSTERIRRMRHVKFGDESFSNS